MFASIAVMTLNVKSYRDICVSVYGFGLSLKLYLDVSTLKRYRVIRWNELRAQRVVILSWAVVFTDLLRPWRLFIVFLVLRAVG